MSIIVDVKLWGVTIGKLAYDGEQTEVATFEYESNILNATQQLSPLKVNNNKAIHSFEDISYRTFKGVPGFIADSLPDKFGNQLIDQYFADKGISAEEITTLDRLLYVGNRSMGGLEYEPQKDISSKEKDSKLTLSDLAELAEILLDNKKRFAQELEKSNREQALNLLRIGSSAGGARAKALVAIDKDGNIFDGTTIQKEDCKYYLLKFDSSSNSDRDNKDPKGMTRIEYIYSLIAKKCDINMPDTSYIENDGDFHFLIERFDRIKVNNTIEKLHYVSWSGLAHAHRDETGAFSYEQHVLTARELGLKDKDIKEIFKRAVFNIVGRNQDDHTKNFGFLMTKDGTWTLSPAFDMTYSYDPQGKWTKVHQIKFNNKQDHFTQEDIIEFASKCNVSKVKAIKILENTIENFTEFEKLADQHGVENQLKNTVVNSLRMADYFNLPILM